MQEVDYWLAGIAFVAAIGAVTTAGATLFLAAVTAKLADFAKEQVSSAREDAKIGRTLEVCERYDLDPVLSPCVSKLRNIDTNQTLQALREKPGDYYDAIVTILNYFESIAIGVQRNLYDIEIVRDHFSEIFQAHFQAYFGKDAPSVIKEEWFSDEDFDRYKKLCETWSKDSQLCSP